METKQRERVEEKQSMIQWDITADEYRTGYKEYLKFELGFKPKKKLALDMSIALLLLVVFLISSYGDVSTRFTDGDWLWFLKWIVIINIVLISAFFLYVLYKSKRFFPTHYYSLNNKELLITIKNRTYRYQVKDFEAFISGKNSHKEAVKRGLRFDPRHGNIDGAAFSLGITAGSHIAAQVMKNLETIIISTKKKNFLLPRKLIYIYVDSGVVHEVYSILSNCAEQKKTYSDIGGGFTMPVHRL